MIEDVERTTEVETSPIFQLQVRIFRKKTCKYYRYAEPKTPLAAISWMEPIRGNAYEKNNFIEQRN